MAERLDEPQVQKCVDCQEQWMATFKFQFKTKCSRCGGAVKSRPLTPGELPF